MRSVQDADCLRLSPDLEAYLDNELEGPRLVAVQDHLGQCADCRKELDLARQIATQLRALPLLECPPAVVDAIAAQTVHQPNQSPSGASPRALGTSNQRIWAWARAAALIVAGAVGLWGGLFFLRTTAPIDRVSIQESVTQPPTGTDGEQYSEEELARAEVEVRIALAYFGDIAKKAGLVLRDEVISERVVEPPRRALLQFGSTDH